MDKCKEVGFLELVPKEKLAFLGVYAYPSDLNMNIDVIDSCLLEVFWNEVKSHSPMLQDIDFFERMHTDERFREIISKWVLGKIEPYAVGVSDYCGIINHYREEFEEMMSDFLMDEFGDEVVHVYLKDQDSEFPIVWKVVICTDSDLIEKQWNTIKSKVAKALERYTSMIAESSDFVEPDEHTYEDTFVLLSRFYAPKVAVELESYLKGGGGV